MKTELDYKEKYLQNKEGDMFLTVDSLIEVNNLIVGKNNTELRKFNVKLSGYKPILSMVVCRNQPLYTFR